ncbi:hypothetical protein TrVE_jg757 [Triparma verrucosa]|uniref:JmjC domain-containing protein n=1 Tax=Triparma verrucosa TaxID=1606542 RepID=A0A9W7FBW8_9STRA|nr:hypothetical protein TrVE_jg757 [Triparma verrucosa]
MASFSAFLSTLVAASAFLAYRHSSILEVQTEFDFQALWHQKFLFLPKLTPVNRVSYNDEGFDIDAIYRSGFPTLITDTTDKHSSPPHFWSEKYVKSALEKNSSVVKDFSVILTENKFIRGTDLGRKHVNVKHHEEALEWLLGDTLLAEYPELTCYVGLVDLHGVEELKRDAKIGLPNFMFKVKNQEHSIPYTEGVSTLGLWVGSGDIDSGLHYDQNAGGFMYLVQGSKQVIMFPQSDRPNLYMNEKIMHKMESTLFLGELLLQPFGKNIFQYLNLWLTSPYLAKMMPGDVLYIPHEWFHEIYSAGMTIGVSSWVNLSDNQS